MDSNTQSNTTFTTPPYTDRYAPKILWDCRAVNKLSGTFNFYTFYSRLTSLKLWSMIKQNMYFYTVILEIR